MSNSSVKLHKLEDFVFDNDDHTRLFFCIYENFYRGDHLDDVEYMTHHHKRFRATLLILAIHFVWDDSTCSWSIKNRK